MSHSQSLHKRGNKFKQGDVTRPSDDVIKIWYGNDFTLEEEDLQYLIKIMSKSHDFYANMISICIWNTT